MISSSIQTVFCKMKNLTFLMLSYIAILSELLKLHFELQNKPPGTGVEATTCHEIYNIYL